MSLEEALAIAARMEEDQVCGPVGLALRLVYAELKKSERELALARWALTENR